MTIGGGYYAVTELYRVAPDPDEGFSMRVVRMQPDPASVLLDAASIQVALPRLAEAFEEAALDGEATIEGGDECRRIRDHVNQRSGREDTFEQRVEYEGAHFRLLYVTL